MRLRKYLAQPISIQSLVVTRVLFGAIMIWDCWRYIRDLRIERYYVETPLQLPYFGWEFISPLPEPYIHWAWIGVGVTAFMVMIGLFYRAAIIGFILLFGYFFLLDRLQYLNHNYMVLLFATLLAFAPAHKAWSIDAVLRPGWGSRTIARWPVTAIKVQLEIILIFAGVVKITDDWLRGEPLRIWLGNKQDDIFFGALFNYDWSFVAASWGVVGLHILGAPLLLWRRTRLPVFLIYVFFHISNAQLFNIGIFPWMTIALTLIFFDPDWPEQVLRRLGVWRGGSEPLPRRTSVAPVGKGLMVFLAAWFAVQLFLPLRQGFFPNLVGWTGDGHRFSWRMRIYDREASGMFRVVDEVTGANYVLDPLTVMSSRSARTMMARSDLVLAFARKIEALSLEGGGNPVAIYADIEMGLNGREPQPFIDPTVDLTQVEYNWLSPDPWVLPLEARAATEHMPDWFPPLPLMKP